MTAPAIVRIVAVLDTRSWTEVGDRWVPVAGSGRPRPCDRCGREHEVHVDVELADGRVACIGQGCARGDSLAPAIRRAATAAATHARLARQLEHARADLATAEGMWSAVCALLVPEPELLAVDERGFRRYGADGVWVGVMPGCPFDAERRGCYVRTWREARYRAACSRRDLPGQYASTVAELERQLARAARKLPAVA